MSVRGLARDIGVSPSLISQIETDKSQPSVSTLYAITTALDITIEELFGELRARRGGPGPLGGRGARIRRCRPKDSVAWPFTFSSRFSRTAGCA